MERTYIVYAAYNLVTGLWYIGYSKTTIKKRRNGGHYAKMRAAQKEYPDDMYWKWDILHRNIPTKALAVIYEAREIQNHDSYYNGYNKTRGNYSKDDLFASHNDLIDVDSYNLDKLNIEPKYIEIAKNILNKRVEVGYIYELTTFEKRCIYGSKSRASGEGYYGLLKMICW